MNMRRLLSLVVAIVMMFSIVGTQLVVANAIGEPTITVGSGTGERGEDVTLTIELSNNPGICAAQIWVHYAEGLVLKSATDSGLLAGAEFGGDKNANPYGLSWEDGTNAERADNTGNGTLVTLVFTIDPSAELGDHDVSVTYDSGDIYNMALEDVDFALVSGTVTVNCQHVNTEIRDDEEPSCNEPGYSGDTWCIDCETKIEDGIVISATGNHIDADGEWESDETHHFHTCSCSTEFDKFSHDYELAHNETSHFERCTVCGIEKEPEACSFGEWTYVEGANTHKKVCACGNFKEEDCDYDATHISGTNRHQGVCKVCEHSIESAACRLRVDATLPDEIGEIFVTTFSCAKECGNVTNNHWVKYGDISNDGKISVVDVIFILQIIGDLRSPDTVYCELGDVHQEVDDPAGFLNTMDAIALLRYLLTK